MTATITTVGELSAEQLRPTDTTDGTPQPEAGTDWLAEAERLAAATTVVPTDSVRPHPKNANQGNVGAIGASLAANGMYRTIVVQQSTGYVLAGNHTWKAAKAEGRDWIAVIELDVDDERAERILLADNRTAELGSGYDDKLLAELLGGLARTETGLEGTGFGEPDLSALLEGMGSELLGGELTDDGELPEHDDSAATAGDDAAEDTPEAPEDDRGQLLALADISVAPPRHECKLGQVWRLGHHTLAVANVHTAWEQWVPLLQPGAILVPYPGPMTALTEKAETTPLLLVQPEPYLAGHVLDKYAAIHGADSVQLQ